MQATIGQWADYLICDPDGIASPDGKPQMWPREAAYAVLADLRGTVERITGEKCNYSLPPEIKE